MENTHQHASGGLASGAPLADTRQQLEEDGDTPSYARGARAEPGWSDTVRSWSTSVASSTLGDSWPKRAPRASGAGNGAAPNHDRFMASRTAARGRRASPRNALDAALDEALPVHASARSEFKNSGK